MSETELAIFVFSVYIILVVSECTWCVYHAKL